MIQQRPQKLILDGWGMLKPFHFFRIHRVQGTRRNYATELNVNDYEYLSGKYDLKGRKTILEQLQLVNVSLCTIITKCLLFLALSTELLYAHSSHNS